MYIVLRMLYRTPELPHSSACSKVSEETLEMYGGTVDPWRDGTNKLQLYVYLGTPVDYEPMHYYVYTEIKT